MFFSKAFAVSLSILFLSFEIDAYCEIDADCGGRGSSGSWCRDCTVSRWSGWSDCSVQCGTSGYMTRTRWIETSASSCGRCPYRLSETSSCNRYCYNGGTLRYSYCSCRSGYQGTCCGSGKLENCVALLFTSLNCLLVGFVSFLFHLFFQYIYFF